MAGRVIFPEQLECRWLPREQWRNGRRTILVLKPFPRVHLDTGKVDWCPPGYRSDGASVPRIFWRIMNPFDEALEAAVHHDLDYALGRYERPTADRYFLRGMDELGVSWPKRTGAYTAVRLGGWSGYKLPAEYAQASAAMAAWNPDQGELALDY